MTPTPQPTGLICLGASAGGLRSLEAIVARLQPDLPWPVLISQHLQPDRVSQMPEILSRAASMPVREATDGETPLPGTIYTSPSSHELGVAIDGRLSLRPIVAGRPQRIDHLFATASYARPGRTIAVVLSGTGTDGAMGSLVVKLNAGTVIAESDESAQQPAMPAAAQRAGTVDATLGADAIASLLDDLARGGLDEATSAMHASVASIARSLTKPDGPDFAHYRATTIRRQAERRRAILGLRSLHEYGALVAADAAERDALVRSLLIPVTEFFRDPAAWRILEAEVLPLLARNARDGAGVRVWCVGCATGEEAYSIAILLAEAISDLQRVQVVATDLDPVAIQSAIEGSYDGTRLQRVDPQRRERFFAAKDDRFVVAEELRQMVQFRPHDATRDEPPGQFDLIICRNLLIYFDEVLQERALEGFRDALKGPRILFMGRSETLPSHGDGFAAVSRAMRIFRATGAPPDPDEGAHPDPHSGWSGGDVRVEAPDALVILLDEAWRITEANDRARALLEDDLVGVDLFEVFPRWHGSPIHDALRTSSESGRSLKVRAAPTPHGPMDFTLERAPGSKRGTLLIGTPAVATSPSSHLARVRETHDDLAATNDELQSANEELAATNEELQATNEELASLNEEFQSTNQTLASTNVELGAVAKTAQTATALIDEFLQTRQEAIVACDADGRVTLYNRKAADLFGLTPIHIGRPVHLLPLGVPGTQLAAWLSAAEDGAVRHPVEHGGSRTILGIEHLRDGAGSPLGWVLSWAPAP